CLTLLVKRVRYTFEEGFDELFTDKFGICESLSKPPWKLGQYSNVGIPALNKQSTSFITPQPFNESCTSSFYFPMQRGTTIETGVPYLTGADGTAGLPGPLRGWYNFTFSVRGPFTQEGFLQIWGRGYRDPSVILVDSFRVIPPGMDESFCRTYEVNKSPIPALKYQVPLTS
ncbi:hypothetical protein HW555_010249, partial [Spodoptera exigua]